MAFIGFLGTIMICALPVWKVPAIVGANNVTTQTIGHMQSRVNNFLLALPQETKASRALCLHRVQCALHRPDRGRCALHQLPRLLLSIAVGAVLSLSADRHTPSSRGSATQERRAGVSIYVGWVAGAQLIIGGRRRTLVMDDKKERISKAILVLD
ncbi:unnamed protein product [Coregonus sp. 'balchen']|nr:unnamed protein product [Coregonus sp. 'balchen']